MSKIDLTIPSLENKFIDLRDKILGDAYNFSWERNLSQVNYLAIHHTGGADTQTPQEIAEIHVTKNGWGGIGYHFLISKNGEVFYVGDISTARANVANLNEQVLGIGLIGNFVQGLTPSPQQLDSAHKLCEFLINFELLPNITAWDKVRGHKELPGQTTSCPGDNWEAWRIQIVEGFSQNRNEGFVFNASQTPTLQSQVESLQASLAALNQQKISLQETLAQREQEIISLKQKSQQAPAKDDQTLTVVGVLINLYKILFPPREAAS